MIRLTTEQAQQIEEALDTAYGLAESNWTEHKYATALATIRAARAQEQAELNLEQSDAVRKMIDISEEHERQRKYAGKYESGYTQSLAEQQAEMEQDAERNVVGLAEQAEQEPVAIVVSEHTHSEYASIKYLADRRLPCKTKLYTTLIEPVEQEPVAEVVLRNQIIGFGRTDERKDIKFLADVDIGSKLYSVPVRTKDLTSEDIDDAYEAAGKKFKSWQQSVHGQMMSEHDFFVTYFAHELITKYKELNK